MLLLKELLLNLVLGQCIGSKLFFVHMSSQQEISKYWHSISSFSSPTIEVLPIQHIVHAAFIARSYPMLYFAFAIISRLAMAELPLFWKITFHFCSYGGMNYVHTRYACMERSIIKQKCIVQQRQHWKFLTKLIIIVFRLEGCT